MKLLAIFGALFLFIIIWNLLQIQFVSGAIAFIVILYILINFFDKKQEDENQDLTKK